jgi:hypothetical protein
MLPIERQLKEARARIGRTPGERMRWVIEFSRLSLPASHSVEMMNLRYELAVFGELLIFAPDDTFPWRTSADLSRPNWQLPSEKIVRSCQAAFRSSLYEVVETGAATLETPPLKHQLFWGDKPLDSKDLMYAVTGIPAGSDGPYTYVLVQLLMTHGHRIRYCGECDQIFLADRRNKTYCSLSCQTRAGTRRFRRRHGLISGRPPGRPRKSSLSNNTPSKSHTLKKAK